VFVHSHPGGVGEFSPQDDHEEPKLMTFLDTRVPGRLHGSLVIASPSDLRGRVWVRGRRHAPLPEFFDRQVRAFGEDVQRLLRALHVGVVGAGGTGSYRAAVRVGALRGVRVGLGADGEALRLPDEVVGPLDGQPPRAPGAGPRARCG
jgi:hypothetical protein